VKIEAAQANDQIASGKLTAALVVPAGFSDQTLAGQASQLTLWVDATTPTAKPHSR